MKTRYLLYFLLTIALIYLIVAVMLPVSAKYTPLCGSCHAVRQEYKTAKNSSHSRLGCLACHSEPGLGGKTMLILKAGRNFLVAVTGAKTSAPARVSNDICLNCHDNLLYDITTTNNLRVKHREIIAAGWLCAECHADTGHKLRITKSLIGTPSMDKCFTCHKSGGADTACGLCHKSRSMEKRGLDNPETMGRLAHTTRWLKRHGIVDSKTCGACHRQDFCAKCHQIKLPHSQNWPDKHGKVALQNQSACTTCHLKKFCRDCHKVDMPHPRPYYHNQDNNPIKTCARCHVESDCINCHKLHAAHKVKGK